ncbi:MAG: N-methyl-L-tryptophan oxidase [Planctomycetaceae bacterium]
MSRAGPAGDVIVIGGGAMGSAAAAEIARRGARVVVLDRFPPPHDRGSSHGESRLIRLAYFEHPDYVPLLRAAYRRWRDLESATGRALLDESGLLIAGPPDGEAIRGTLRAAAVHGLDVDRCDAATGMARFPPLRLPDDWILLHERVGGWLRVEACVQAALDRAVAHGAEIVSGVTALAWREVGDGVVVDTDRGSYQAGRLVIAAGPWAGDLLRLPAMSFVVLRKGLFWIEAAAAARAPLAVGAFPCFAFDTPDGFFYGFPSLDGRTLKVAEHSGGAVVTDPLTVDRGVDATERARVERVIGAHLPAVRGPLAKSAVCLYTMSPDGHFILGLHPRHRRVAVAAGFSGHGFKFAPLVGDVLADLALDGTTDHPIGFLSPDRW